MIELWSKEQLAAKMPSEELRRIGVFLSLQPEPIGMNVTTADSDGQPVAWEVIEYKWIPAESIHVVLKLVGRGSLFLQGFADQGGIEIQQVFKRKRMIPVIDYVDLKTKQADPGESTMFG